MMKGYNFIAIRIFILSIILLLMPVIGQAGDYEIEKVIEVGPCSGVPMTWPLKWSPDGTKLAYFNDNSLYLSDTLGNYEQIAHVEPYPHRYEWLSNQEIVIQLYNHLVEPQTFKLIKIDIGGGQTTILEEFVRALKARPKNNPNSFSGPFLTVEGRLYYRTNVLRATVLDPVIRDEPRPIVFPESKYPRNIDRLSPAENHIFSWGKDAIYLVNGNLTDSINTAPKNQHPVKLPIVGKPDLSRYMIHSTICDLEGQSCVSIDTFLTRSPGVVGYGFLYYSFDPQDTEVLFQLDCEKNSNLEEGKPYDERKSYEEFSIATFNYVSNKLTILDSLIDLKRCKSPTYSPDGNKIAFWHGRNVYIMYRRGL